MQCLICNREAKESELHCGRIECKVKVRMCYDKITCKGCEKTFILKKAEYRNSSDHIFSEDECSGCVKEAKRKAEVETPKKRGRKKGTPLTEEEKKEREKKRFYKDLEKATENVEAEIRRFNIKNAWSANTK